MSAVKLSEKATGAIIALGKLGRATAKEMGSTLGTVVGLAASGFVTTDGTIKGSGRGRPANAYKLTRKGKGRYTTLKRA